MFYIISSIICFIAFFAYVYFCMPKEEIRIGMVTTFIIAAAIPFVNLFFLICITCDALGAGSTKFWRWLIHNKKVTKVVNKIFNILDTTVIKERD